MICMFLWGFMIILLSNWIRTNYLKIIQTAEAGYNLLSQVNPLFCQIQHCLPGVSSHNLVLSC